MPLDLLVIGHDQSQLVYLSTKKSRIFFINASQSSNLIKLTKNIDFFRRKNIYSTLCNLKRSIKTWRHRLSTSILVFIQRKKPENRKEKCVNHAPKNLENGFFLCSCKYREPFFPKIRLIFKQEWLFTHKVRRNSISNDKRIWRKFLRKEDEILLTTLVEQEEF